MEARGTDEKEKTSKNTRRMKLGPKSRDERKTMITDRVVKGKTRLTSRQHRTKENPRIRRTENTRKGRAGKTNLGEENPEVEQS